MKKFLFFDVETIGLPRNWLASPEELDNWPRMVQMSWIIATETEKMIDTKNFIIKPSGFTIPEGMIHGISHEMALNVGVDLKFVLKNFLYSIEKSDVIVAHNINFDKNVVLSELIRNNMPLTLNDRDNICTMHTSKEFCKLPGFYGDYKWPKLEELYKILFKKEYPNSHNAINDVKACMDCFFELKRRNIIVM